MSQLFLVGVKDAPYTDKISGEVKRSRELHFVCDSPSQAQDYFRGVKVLTERVSFDTSMLKLQAWYYPEWDIRQFSGTTYTNLVGLELVPDSEK